MKKILILLFAIAIILFSCSSTTKINFKTTNIELKLGKIEYFVSLENQLQSKDITRDHFVDVGESIYPYRKNHDFLIPKEYVFYPQKSIELNKSYYYTKTNDVKLILYEWNKTDTSSVSNKTFKNIFNSLESRIEAKLGRESSKNIASDTIKSSETYRDEVKWENSDLKAYLFRFGDKENRFNQIRLAIYKD